uniref:DUF4502 domain-containing protein n=1 Tax=Oryctolagus cuniculus TaxID=9986 RepID=A0A5F9D2Z6_RABIT
DVGRFPVASVLVDSRCALWLEPRPRLLPRHRRKKNRGIEYPSFPGDGPLPCRGAGIRTGGAAVSLLESWRRCGEGFQDTSGTPSLLTAEKKTITEKYPELSPRPKEGNITLMIS